MCILVYDDTLLVTIVENVTRYIKNQGDEY